MEKEDKNVKLALYDFISDQSTCTISYDFMPDQSSFRKYLMKRHKNSQLMDKHDFKENVF